MTSDIDQQNFVLGDWQGQHGYRGQQVIGDRPRLFASPKLARAMKELNVVCPLFPLSRCEKRLYLELPAAEPLRIRY